MKAKGIALFGCVAALALVGGCSAAPKTDAQGFVIDPDFEKNLQARLLDAKPGDVIDIQAGKYALSRSLSPAMIAEYQTQLPDKKLLQAKLHEFYMLNLAQEGEV